MMVYLKNVVGFKMDYFKGMSYDDIQESRTVKRINETPAEKAAKRKKLEDEVEELKRHFQIVPNEDDDVYTEATPLARKVYHPISICLLIITELPRIYGREINELMQDLWVLNGQAVQTIIPNNAAFQTEDLDTYDSDCDDLSNTQVVLMTNISNYDSDVISEVPDSETDLNDMENQSVLVMQDFEQPLAVDSIDNEIHSDNNIILYSQYLQETQQEKANNEQNNESVTAKLERYKGRVKSFKQCLNIDLSSHEKIIDSQMDDTIKEKIALKEQVGSLEQNLFKQIKEKECLLQTLTVYKIESKEKEDKYMENKIDLEKKIKELDNILFKVGQSAQTVHMLTKPQAFYDNIHKQALGYQNLFHLKKAQQIKPTLYDGIVMSDKHVAMHLIDDEKTLILEEKTQLQEKDITICKLKDIIKSLREKSKEKDFNYDYGEIETKNVELENNVEKLSSKNERLCNEINHVKQVFKEKFDLIKKTHVHTKEKSDSLIDKLNLKSVENKDLKAQIQDKVVQIILWYLDSGCSKHMTGNRSQLMNFVSKFMGKSKKSSHQPKAEDTNQEKLYLLHMDLCGPMRVASINEKRCSGSNTFHMEIKKQLLTDVNDGEYVILFRITNFEPDTHTSTLTPRLLRTVLQIPPPDPNNTYTKPPSEIQILEYIKTLGYDEDPETKMIVVSKMEGSKASKLKSLKKNKPAVVGEGSSVVHNKYYASSDTDSDAKLDSSCLEKLKESANETDDADESDMELSNDNLNGDDDAAGYGVFMHKKFTATPNSIYLSLTITTKKPKAIIQKDKLTIAYLEGVGLERLKQQYKNDVELKYHVDQLKAAVLTEAKWNSDEDDVLKPRTFERNMYKNTKPHPSFYNNDFYYLVYLSMKEKYTTSITKHYATRYYKQEICTRIKGIVYSDLRIKSVVRVVVKKK
nr:hypothetical protein [Tanacetum cinerariifolium]